MALKQPRMMRMFPEVTSTIRVIIAYIQYVDRRPPNLRFTPQQALDVLGHRALIWGNSRPGPSAGSRLFAINRGPAEAIDNVQASDCAGLASRPSALNQDRASRAWFLLVTIRAYAKRVFA